MFVAGSGREIAAALSAIAADDHDSLVVLGDSRINPSSRDIAEFAIAHRMVTIGSAEVHARQGCLLYYGPDIADLAARTAGYVHRVLQGDHPAGMPVEAPSRYELVVNMRTARLLGVQLPPSLQLRVSRTLGS